MGACKTNDSIRDARRRLARPLWCANGGTPGFRAAARPAVVRVRVQCVVQAKRESAVIPDYAKRRFETSRSPSAPLANKCVPHETRRDREQRESRLHKVATGAGRRAATRTTTLPTQTRPIKRKTLVTSNNGLNTTTTATNPAPQQYSF